MNVLAGFTLRCADDAETSRLYPGRGIVVGAGDRAEHGHFQHRLRHTAGAGAVPGPGPARAVWSQARGGRDRTSLADYLEWKKRARSFRYLKPFWPRGFNLGVSETPERVRARQTSTDGHRMYGEDVLIGRDFATDEDQPGKNHVALLKHRLGRDRFGSDPGVIRRDISLNGTPYRVIGVLRPGVTDRPPADLWVPLTLNSDEIANRRGARGGTCPGATPDPRRRAYPCGSRLGAGERGRGRDRAGHAEYALRNGSLESARTTRRRPGPPRGGARRLLRAGPPRERGGSHGRFAPGVIITRFLE